MLRTKGAYRGKIERISFGDLMVRSDWASVDFAGGIDLSGNAATMLNGRLNAELRGLPMGGPALASFFKEPARLQSAVVYMPEGERLKFADLKLTHPKISAEGDVEIGFMPQLLRGGLKARIANPAAFSKLVGIDLAGGPIDISLATGPAGTAVNSTVTATADTLTISGTRLKAIKAALTLKDVETQSGSLDIAFTGPAGAVKATTDISRSKNPDRVALNGLKLTAAGGELHGNLTVPLGEGAASGALDGQFASLDAVSALVGRNLHGSATFSVSFSDIDGQQGVTGNLTADQFSADLGPDSKVAIKHIMVATSGDITQLRQGVPFSLQAQGVRSGDVRFDTLAMSGTTNFHKAEYKIDVAGAYRGMMTLSAAGSADWDSPDTVIRIDSLSGMHAKTAIQLVKPASLTLKENGLDLEQTTLEIGDGRVTLGAKRGADTLNGHLTLDKLPFAAIHAFVPDGPAAGTLSGTADIDVAADRQSGRAKLQMTDLALTPDEKAPERLDGTIDATWRDAGLDLKGQFSGQGGAMISASAMMPLQYEAGSFRVPGDGRLRGQVDWNADVGPFWNAFGTDSETLDGRMEASLKLGGTVSDPTATGDVALHDGRFVDLEMGTVLEKLSLQLEADRQQIRLIEASATDGGSGKVTAKGRVGLDPDDKFPIQLDVTADKAKLVRRTDVTATLSGTLSFEKTGKSSTLKGMITANEIEAILVDLSSPDVVKLDVTEIGFNGQVMAPPQGQEAQAGQKATQLDVAVNVPGQAFIRGRGLDSEWKGNLKVTGPLADPHIVGALNVVRGNFKFAGRTFGLDRGQISFQGGSKIDPELNLQATYSVSDLKAMVNVTGPSSSPNVKLSSTPGLPQDEILSRILFGSSVADLSPLQAVQLADAVRGLGKPGGGLLGSARSVIGLDVLQIGSSSQAGSGLEATTITGGKYIAKNVYLEVETAANGGQEKVGVDLGLTKNLSVESNVSPQQGSRVGLKWKHDY